jgi:hypothetical protein
MKSIITLTLALLAFSLAASADAQQLDNDSSVRFRPSILAGAELPPAGEKVELKVTLDGLSDVHARLTVFLAQDESFEQRFLTPQTYDEGRRPIYSTTLYAPRAELRYRFEVADTDGKIHRSREFISRRGCVEQITPIATYETLTSASNPKELVELQLKVATRLEHEVQQLENVLELLSTLEKELP